MISIRSSALSFVFASSTLLAQQWLPASESGFGTYRVGAAYDSARARIVSTDGGSLREWDGSGWRSLFAAATNTSLAIAYDPVRQRTLWLRAEGPTWGWDGVAWTPRAGASPPPRFATALAWDPVSQKVLAFGGFGTNTNTNLQDTWLYDGTNWTQPPVGSRPSARQAATLSTDTGRNRVVLYGGNANTGPLDDTWEWNGTAWLQFFPATHPTLTGQAQAYDPVRARTLLVGQGSFSNGPLQQWEWNGSAWTQRTPAVMPDPRNQCGLMADPTRGTVLLWGGSGGNGQLADTWEWDGTAWTQVVQARGPVFVAGAAADPVHGHVVALGQALGSSSEAWTWDGATWTRVVRALLPPARSRASMAFDPGRQRVVMFGGDVSGNMLNDTWEWDGLSWLNRTPVTVPALRRGQALAFAGSSSGVLMFGGSGSFGQPLYDTWLWNGLNWIEVTPITGSVPPPRFDLGLASAFGTVVLFGGTDGLTSFDDTWSWTGNAWVQLAPAHRPPPRSRHAMVGQGGNLVRVAGGRDPSDHDLDDTWTYDGTDWTAGPPLPRAERDAVLVIDPRRSIPVAIGGASFVHVELDMLTATPAAGVEYGQGCTGTKGVPRLRAAGRPFLGSTTFRLHVGEVPANALTAVLIDGQSASVPLPGGCTQLVANTSTLAVGTANAASFAGFTVPIPAVPAFLGLSFFTQAAALDTGGALQNIAVLTNGLELRLGH